MKLATKSSVKSERTKKLNNNSCQFIVKLVQMMKQYPNNVKWSDNGQYICFDDLATVESLVIPNFFRHRNMLSFVRQLNMYYFSKVESDEDNIMKFKHAVFKKGNQNNFHMISRRNKTRDQIIGNIQKTYPQTLSILQKQTKLSEQTKSLVRVAIEYNLIALKNMKKIKAAVEDLGEHMKTVRSKQVKNALSKLKEEYMNRLNQLIEDQKNLEIFAKESLCRDLNFINNPMSADQIPLQGLGLLPSQINLFDQQYRTLMDIQLVRGLNFHSENSLLNFKSDCSLQKNLKEQQEQIGDKNEQISLQQDLKDQNIQQ